MNPPVGDAWPQGWWGSARRRDSPNFGPRPAGVRVDLAVIHAIVCEHGGAVMVKTCPGAGSAFEVILPAAPATALPARPPSPRPVAQ